MSATAQRVMRATRAVTALLVIVVWGSQAASLTGVWPGFYVSFNEHRAPLQWIPGSATFEAFSSGHFLEPVQNLLLFVPLGFFLAWGFRLRYPAVAVVAFLVSLTIEVCQSFTFDRVSSVDDIIVNVLGALAGVALLAGAAVAFRFLKRHLWEPSSEPVAEISAASDDA